MQGEPILDCLYTKIKNFFDEKDFKSKMNVDKLDPNNTYYLLIQKFISGNATNEEYNTLKKWMNQNPENEKLVENLKQIWEITPNEKFEVDVESAWTEFQKKQNNGLGFSNSEDNSKKLLYALRIAAIVLVSLFTGIFVQYTFTDSGSENVSQFYVMQTFETGRGEKARITFSDGTEVVLNSETSINFPKEFKGMTREIKLDGEAYFKVARNENMPFIVYAKDTKVKVLGTEFNVQAWENESSVRISVNEGKVAVTLSGDNEDDNEPRNISKVILKRGFYTTVDNRLIKSPTKLAKVENHLMWVHGGLYFENEPFEKVIRDIERRFDVNINGVDSDLMDVPFTGSFQYADLGEVLDVISVSMDLDYQRNGNEIIIL